MQQPADRARRLLPRAHALALSAATALAFGVAGCAMDMGGFSFMKKKTAEEAVPTNANVSDAGPLLGADGRCPDDGLPRTGPRGMPQSIDLGMSECELVRVKGQPTDVLIGSDGKGGREVQVLYQEPTGKKLFLFSSNKLTRVVD
jgi:hypothetical protein